MSCQNKRLRTDDDEQIPPPPPLLSQSDVDTLVAAVAAHRDTLILCTSNERETTTKVKLRNAITCFCDAFFKVSTAYSQILASENTVNSLKKDMGRVIDYVEASNKSLANIAASVINVASVQEKTYASVAKHTAVRVDAKLNEKMTLNNGKTLPIRSDSQVFICPRDPSSEVLNSSAATKSCFLERIKPAEIGLRINRILLGPDKSIILEGDSSNSELLKQCAQLAEAGLEMKDCIKRNPRIIIHGIPNELSSDDILQALHKQNFPEHDYRIFKIIYHFPERESKSFRSCIVEMPSDCRQVLCKSSRVYIGSQSCRCVDHISVVQCFNCYRFGHIAIDCKNAKCCGSCALVHLSKDCPKRSVLCCVNCKDSGHNDTKHASYDRLKCPRYRAILLRKSASINYGD